MPAKRASREQARTPIYFPHFSLRHGDTRTHLHVASHPEVTVLLSLSFPSEKVAVLFACSGALNS